VNNNIKQQRQARDWTQQQLAESLGVSRQTIISIESGKYDPSLALAFKIGKLFGQKIEDIFQAGGD
jgi:putative transcriptional regulator